MTREENHENDELRRLAEQEAAVERLDGAFDAKWQEYSHSISNGLIGPELALVDRDFSPVTLQPVEVEGSRFYRIIRRVADSTEQQVFTRDDHGIVREHRYHPPFSIEDIQRAREAGDTGQLEAWLVEGYANLSLEHEMGLNQEALPADRIEEVTSVVESLR